MYSIENPLNVNGKHKLKKYVRCFSRTWLLCHNYPAALLIVGVWVRVVWRSNITSHIISHDGGSTCCKQK